MSELLETVICFQPETAGDLAAVLAQMGGANVREVDGETFVDWAGLTARAYLEDGELIRRLRLVYRRLAFLEQAKDSRAFKDVFTAACRELKAEAGWVATTEHHVEARAKLEQMVLGKMADELLEAYLGLTYLDLDMVETLVDGPHLYERDGDLLPGGQMVLFASRAPDPWS